LRVGHLGFDRGCRERRERVVVLLDRLEHVGRLAQNKTDCRQQGRRRSKKRNSTYEC
jgi:hypothetical protein